MAPAQERRRARRLFLLYTTGDAAKTYARNMEGWRDSFNFADLVLREVEGTEYIAGLRLVKESGVKFGLFTEEGNIWDYYPYWHSWITFTLEAGVVVKPPEAYKNYLYKGGIKPWHINMAHMVKSPKAK